MSSNSKQSEVEKFIVKNLTVKILLEKSVGKKSDDENITQKNMR